MKQPEFTPPWWLYSGMTMTVYAGLRMPQIWQQQTREPEPNYKSHVFRGESDVPLFAWVAMPPKPRGTIIGTYGITGSLENQWFLQVLGRKAIAQQYAVILFDWRAHGETAKLSSVLTSDGIYEGHDYVHIAAQAKQLGCPAPFWFTGYSLSGQLALWGVKAAQSLSTTDLGADLELQADEIGGAAVICPNLDSNRSLSYLVKDPLGRYLEQAIAKSLKQLAYDLAAAHPGEFDAAAIARANSIEGFDRELVISRLGFASVRDYYAASSPLPFLPHLQKPTLILYAADDPMFDPAIIPDLKAACLPNPAITLWLTPYGGHVGYISSKSCQEDYDDRDPWWGWNRLLEWIGSHSSVSA
jgi:hypothetical protein